MNTSTRVQKLWSYCNVLRDDGMSYGDYVEQLTYLLFGSGRRFAPQRSRCSPFERPDGVQSPVEIVRIRPSCGASSLT